MNLEELMKDPMYEFECYMSNEYANYDSLDEWGSAFVWLGDRGAELNFCIDGKINSTAIYKTCLQDDKVCTDYDKFEHYEIDFSNNNWQKLLELKMCEVLCKLHDLS